MKALSETIQTALLRWYDAHKRTLPWRDIHNPYATWVSETMLQQTRVETVRAYYDRFMRRFPTVQALAEAPVEDVLKLWEGLGYYRRARNLHAGAQQVAAEFGGMIPDSVDALLTIQGIGPYTAGAIASIAFDKAVPAVDGNVIRVVSRLWGLRENVAIPSVRRRIEQTAADLVDKQRPGDFNQAMMDLGATVCVPGTPNCDACPLRGFCAALSQGDPEELPILPRKNPPRELCWDVCLILSGSRVLMRQRTETMLQGLWVFPMVEGHHTEKSLPAAVKHLTGLPVHHLRAQGDAKHVFTHQVWLMKLYVMDTDAKDAPHGWRFVAPDEIDALTLPTAMRKAVELFRKLSPAP